MGQAEIQKVLQKYKGFISTEKIEELLKGRTQRPAIVTALKQMHKYREVEKKPGKKGPYGRRIFYWRLIE